MQTPSQTTCTRNHALDQIMCVLSCLYERSIHTSCMNKHSCRMEEQPSWAGYLNSNNFAPVQYMERVKSLSAITSLTTQQHSLNWCIKTTINWNVNYNANVRLDVTVLSDFEKKDAVKWLLSVHGLSGLLCVLSYWVGTERHANLSVLQHVLAVTSENYELRPSRR